MYVYSGFLCADVPLSNYLELVTDSVKIRTFITASVMYCWFWRYLCVSVTGNGLANSGDYVKAIKCFTEAIRLDPSEFRFQISFSTSSVFTFCLCLQMHLNS